MKKVIHPGYRGHVFGCVKLHLLVVDAGYERVALVVTHQQNQQPRRNLSFDERAKKGQIEQEWIAVSVDVADGDSDRKERALNRVDDVRRAAELKHAATMAPTRFALAGCDRTLELGCRFVRIVNAFGLEQAQMAQLRGREQFCWQV